MVENIPPDSLPVPVQEHPAPLLQESQRIQVRQDLHQQQLYQIFSYETFLGLIMNIVLEVNLSFRDSSTTQFNLNAISLILLALEKQGEWLALLNFRTLIENHSVSLVTR